MFCPQRSFPNQSDTHTIHTFTQSDFSQHSVGSLQQDFFFFFFYYFPIWFVSLILLNFSTNCFLYFMVSIYSFSSFSDHFLFLRIPPPEFWGLSSWNPIYKTPIFQSFFKVFLIMAFSTSALLTFGADNFLF